MQPNVIQCYSNSALVLYRQISICKVPWLRLPRCRLLRALSTPTLWGLQTSQTPPVPRRRRITALQLIRPKAWGHPGFSLPFSCLVRKSCSSSFNGYQESYRFFPSSHLSPDDWKSPLIGICFSHRPLFPCLAQDGSSSETPIGACASVLPGLTQTRAVILTAARTIWPISHHIPHPSRSISATGPSAWCARTPPGALAAAGPMLGMLLPQIPAQLPTPFPFRLWSNLPSQRAAIPRARHPAARPHPAADHLAVLYFPFSFFPQHEPPSNILYTFWLIFVVCLPWLEHNPCEISILCFVQWPIPSFCNYS